MEITPRVVVCVNLMDEAKKKNIAIDLPALAAELGVPVIGAAARRGEGLAELKDTLYQVVSGDRATAPRPLVYSPAVEAAVQQLLPSVVRLVGNRFNPRWVALRLLDGDPAFIGSIQRHLKASETPSLLKEAAAL